MNRKYVFGPVASRRLGLSLGVDLVTPKTCSLDCIYCEAKATTCHTLERKEYVPVDAVIAELDDVLKSSPKLDYITFSGAGEPTLSTAIGPVISFLKANYPQHPVCVLTNGMLLHDRQLREEIAQADLVIPSLDASCAEEFTAINRPAQDIDFETFTAGLTQFTQEFKNRIYLELFIVPGINDSDASIIRFAQIIQNMRLDKIQLNALDRCGTEDDVPVSSAENAARFAAVLSKFANVEFVGRNNQKNTQNG